MAKETLSINVEIKNLNEFLQLLEQLKELIEKINAFKFKIEPDTTKRRKECN